MEAKNSKRRTTKSRVAAAIKSADLVIEAQKEALQEAIEEINVRLRPYDELIERRNLLQRSLNALSGGSALTGEGTTRLTQVQVIEFLRKNPGATPSAIADQYNVKQATASSHLYRGKDERYITDGDGHWWLRDPKNGIDTIDDVLATQEED